MRRVARCVLYLNFGITAFIAAAISINAQLRMIDAPMRLFKETHSAGALSQGLLIAGNSLHFAAQKMNKLFQRTATSLRCQMSEMINDLVYKILLSQLKK